MLSYFTTELFNVWFQFIKAKAKLRYHIRDARCKTPFHHKQTLSGLKNKSWDGSSFCHKVLLLVLAISFSTVSQQLLKIKKKHPQLTQGSSRNEQKMQMGLFDPKAVLLAFLIYVSRWLRHTIFYMNTPGTTRNIWAKKQYGKFSWVTLYPVYTSNCDFLVDAKLCFWKEGSPFGFQPI